MIPEPRKKLFAFIIALMMFSVIPALVNAQKKCSNGHCPKGYTCVDGHCVKSGGGGFCNCFVKPIPFECGQICGFLADKTPANDQFSISVINSSAISFELNEPQNVSLKIYDATGRLIKTLADSRMPEGEYQIDWNIRDDKGSTISSGIYILRFSAGSYSDTKRLTII